VFSGSGTVDFLPVLRTSLITRGMNTGKNLAMTPNQILTGVRKAINKETRKTAGDTTVLFMPNFTISEVSALLAR
jgi:hypothetical protein